MGHERRCARVSRVLPRRSRPLPRCRDGTVESCVAETDTAFHAGVALSPTWSLIPYRCEPQLPHHRRLSSKETQLTIGPLRRSAATTSLIEDIARRWRIPLDAGSRRPSFRDTAFERLSCRDLPIGAIIAAARAGVTELGGGSPSSGPPSRANLRLGSPSLDAPVARLVAAAVGCDRGGGGRDAGESVSGNSFWYGDGKGNYLWAGATNVPRPADDPLLSMLPKATPPSSDPMELATPPLTAASGHERAGRRSNRTRMALSCERVRARTTVKDLIVLHFTAGTTARSAFDTWRNDRGGSLRRTSLISMARSMRSSHPRRGRRTSAFRAHAVFRIGDRSGSKSPTSGRCSSRPTIHGPELVAKAHSTSPEFTTKFCRLDETEKYMAANLEVNRISPRSQMYRSTRGGARAHVVRAVSIPPSLPRSANGSRAT